MANPPTSKTDPDTPDQDVEDAVVIEESQPEDPLDEAEPVVIEEPTAQDQNEDQAQEPVETTEGMDEDAAPADEADAPEADAAGDIVPDDLPTEETPTAGSRRGGAGFVGLVLGGIVAGAIGFGVALAVGPLSLPFGGTPDEDPLVGIVDAQTAEIADLRALVEAQAQTLATLTSDTSLAETAADLRADIVATQTRIETLGGAVAALEERVSGLEKMPVGDSAAAAEAAAAAYERELAEMRAMLDAEIAALKATQEDAQALELTAAESARAAATRAALSRIMAALESGRPFEDALFDLTQSADIPAPDALTAVAGAGVPTLASLQESFPEAARAALNAALRDMVANDEIGRGEAFLRTQLGSRSLEPREGDDPDAVLSRAEFALKNGRIDDALGELAALRDAAQPALADWIAAARTRQDALAAGSALATTLTQ